MQFYVNAYSACMEIKITKLDEEKVYNEATSSTLEYFCNVKT